MRRGWEAHERYVADLLGLELTAASGATFRDPGDAVDRRRGDFPLLADCKFTEKRSFSVAGKIMSQWQERAALAGKRFVLPVRLWPVNDPRPRDYAVLGLDDFAELMGRWQ